MKMIKDIKGWFYKILKVKKVEKNIPFIILEQDFIVGKKVITLYEKEVVEVEDTKVD